MLDRHLELMWAGAIGAIPVAVAVGVACRVFVRRPATRHALWVMVLGVMFMPGGWWAMTELMRTVEPHAERLASSIRQQAQSEPRPGRSAWHGVIGSPGAPDAAPALTEAPTWGAAQAEPFEFSSAEDATFTPPQITGQAAPIVKTQSFSITEPIASPPPFRDAARAATPRAPVTAEDHAESVPAATPRDRFGAAIGAWAAWAERVRDTALGAPRLPPAVWGGGAMLFAIVIAWRTVRLARLVRSGEPVTARDDRLVGEVCELLGVRRVPRMAVVDRVVTPMVCLGRRATIIVPRALWHGLGEEARRAILTHELAHLRRRDHWVCWGLLGVTCMFWWHPVAWWAGRRIREEADMACDAWVVSILPLARRAYAESLLRVRVFLSSTPPLTPVPALGMASSGVARFSRRITMVMTCRKSPRLSLIGSLAALSAAAVGAVIAPALACPPDCDQSAPSAQVIVMPPSGVMSAQGSAPAAATTFERYMNAAGGDPRAEALVDRFREVEARMHELQAMIEAYATRGGGDAPGVRAFTLDGMAEPAPMSEAMAAERAYAALAPFISGGGYAVAEGEDFERDYYIPQGRLECLTSLMSRSDVPVLIRAAEDHITVIGTAHEHEAFMAFVGIICPEGVRVGGRDGDMVRSKRAPGASPMPAYPSDSLRRRFFESPTDAMTPPTPPPAPRSPAAPSRSGSSRFFETTPTPSMSPESIEHLNQLRDTVRSRMNDTEVRQRRAQIEALAAESLMAKASEALESQEIRPDQAQTLERMITEYAARIAALEAQADDLEAQRDAMESQLDEAEERLEQLLEEAEQAAEAGAHDEALAVLLGGFGR